MEKKNSNNEQEIKKSIVEDRKKRTPPKSVEINQKRLPWWVELLFVQIGLPDKWLIKILKTKKNLIDIYRDEKKLIFFIFLFIVTIGYFQPVVRHSNSKLKCQKIAYNYINEITKLKNKDNKEIEMLSVNFCDGGTEIEKFYKE